MKKAERIFNETYTECRLWIKKHGYEENCGFASLFYKETECVCKRTCNAIQKWIDRERYDIKLSLNLEVITQERFEFLNNALDMVQKTLENNIELIEGKKEENEEATAEATETVENEVKESEEATETVEAEAEEVNTELVGSDSQVKYARNLQNEAIKTVNNKMEELKALSSKGFNVKYDIIACEKTKESLFKIFNRHSDAMWYLINHRLLSVGCVNTNISECIKFLKNSDK